MLLDNLIVEVWGVNMEKISLESLARRLYISNFSIELFADDDNEVVYTGDRNIGAKYGKTVRFL